MSEDNISPLRKIVIDSCMTCPLLGGCKTWKNLTKKQRFALSCGNGVPEKFILKGCKLEDN